MTAEHSSGMRRFVAASLPLVVLACGPMVGNGNDNQNDNGNGFAAASAARGGALYDRWWTAAGVAEPQGDHPLWAARPDTMSNTRTGLDTWRCKECHGWDYKGVDGAYGSGSHRTGIKGILGTMLAADDLFTAIKDTHGFGAMTALTDDDIWDLVKFVLEGVVDTDDLLDGDRFRGVSESGRASYEAACQQCHGADGLAIPPGADADHDDWVGKIANENPWEFQHKVRFGQPGTAMPPQFSILSLSQVSDLGAYSQTLPVAPNGTNGGDAAAGEAFYTANGCGGCHAADAGGGFGPSLVAAEADLLFEILSGMTMHTGGVVDGVTEADAADLAAWLASL